MKILIIKENKSLGLNPSKIYEQIIGGFKRMNLPLSDWCDSITLEDEEDE